MIGLNRAYDGILKILYKLNELCNVNKANAVRLRNSDIAGKTVKVEIIDL